VVIEAMAAMVAKRFMGAERVMGGS